MQLFTASRARWPRPYHMFEAESDETLKRRFGQAVPYYDLRSLQRAYLCLLDLVEADLESVSTGQLTLTDAQRRVLADLRA